MTAAALQATRLVEPGSLIRHHYRIALGGGAGAEPAGDDAVDAFVADARKSFPEAGWDIHSRMNVSPQFARNLTRFTQFLTLVGLTSLIVGGVGVANAIRAYVERKRPVIAILKSLGGTGSVVFALMLTQVMLIACLGVAIGAAAGAALPFAAAYGFGTLIPFPFEPGLHLSAVAEGVAYGILTALMFSIAPLGQAHDVPVQALFREEIEPRRGWPRPRYVALTLAAAAGFLAAVFAFSADQKLAFIYLCATSAAFALLRLIAFLIMRGARRLPHSRSVAIRLAVANIHRPGALTPTVVLSLGLGLALLITLTLIDGNLRAELGHSSPGQTPSFFFLDLQASKAEAFTQFLRAQAPEGSVRLAPMLRGRIVQLNGLSVALARPKESVAWVLQGDRGITFADALPDGSALVKGDWWPADYAGPPLISLETDVAAGLGLEVGDEIGVNVQGRTIVGRVANTRKVNWRSFGINFVLIFSPNSFRGAPHSEIATLTFPGGGDPAREALLLREAARLFPAVTSVRVKDALDALSGIVGRLAVAVRAASSVALLASVLVLAGALGAGQQARIHDAVVLKTLGATRARLFAAFLYEYGLLGFCAAIFGLAAGGAAAYAIVTRVMGLDFVWLWPQALWAAAAALSLTIVLGLAGSWRILGRKPAPYLRNL
jgi:putative ABC transport system permease protein